MGACLPLLAGLTLFGCGSNPPPVPYSALPSVPYEACGDMTQLRNNLTGTPYPSPWSDAELHALGVRCLGEPYPTGLVRARY